MATRKKTKHKTNFVLSRTIWPEPKSAPADVELVIHLQSQGRAAWLCVQSLEREPRGWWGAQELSQVLSRSLGWAASLSSSSSGSCLVLFGDGLSCSLCSSAPRPERSRASGLAGCIKNPPSPSGFYPTPQCIQSLRYHATSAQEKPSRSLLLIKGRLLKHTLPCCAV